VSTVAFLAAVVEFNAAASAFNLGRILGCKSAKTCCRTLHGTESGLLWCISLCAILIRHPVYMSLVEVYLSEGSQTGLHSGSVESESHKGGEHSSLKSGDSRDCDSGIPLYKGAGPVKSRTKRCRRVWSCCDN
jgi:hypothetical protein